MQTKEIYIKNFEDRYIDEPVIVKDGKTKRRERRAKARKK